MSRAASVVDDPGAAIGRIADTVGPTRVASADTVSESTPVAPASQERTLDCVAGFFATETQAQAVAQHLQLTHGLQSTQVVLLGPAQSGWLRFTRRARAWAPLRSARCPYWAADAPLMALLSAFILGLAVAIGLILEVHSGIDVGGGVGIGISTDAGALFYLLTPVVGAGVGWAASAWLPFTPEGRRLNRKVRSELAAGRWVVLTHGVGRSQQGGAFELMQRRARSWYVVFASQ